MCQFEGAAFRECNSCRTCLEVATDIKHIGVKKCQSASPWLLQSTSWQCAGEARGPGMLCPSVNMELPSLADATERIFVTWPWVDFITWPGSVAEGCRKIMCSLAYDGAAYVCGLDFRLIKKQKKVYFCGIYRAIIQQISNIYLCCTPPLALSAHLSVLPSPPSPSPPPLVSLPTTPALLP